MIIYDIWIQVTEFLKFHVRKYSSMPFSHETTSLYKFFLNIFLNIHPPLSFTIYRLYWIVALICIIRIFLTLKIIYVFSLASLAYYRGGCVRVYFFWEFSVIIPAQELGQLHTALISNYGLLYSALKFYSVINILHWHHLRRTKKNVWCLLLQQLLLMCFSVVYICCPKVIDQMRS